MGDDGGFLIADSGNNRIRRVAPGGTIATVAGSGRAGRGRGGFAGDGGPATAARLAEPSGVTEAPGGALLIADTGNDRVRRVTPDGRIATVAGTGRRGFAGDGGPARAARLNGPESVAVAADGDLLIADSGNDRIRRVTPGGRIATIAGSDPSRRGGRTSAPAVAAKGRDVDLDAGDGREATDAALSFPGDVAPTPDGGLLIVDTNHYRVRFVAPPATARLAAAIVGERLRARRCAPAAVRVVATGGGEGRLDLRRGDRRVARVVTALGPGTTVLTFGRAPLPAGVYRLRLRAAGLGAVAVDRAQLTVPRCRRS